MIITCASCLTKFNLDDSRIPQKGVKVRCSRCQHIFYVVPPPETKEEIMEGFQSFARYHEDLMVPGEERTKGPGQEKEEKVSVPSPTAEEEPSKERKIVEALAPEKEEGAFRFEDKAPQERKKTEQVSPEKGEAAGAKPPQGREVVRRKERRGLSPFMVILFVLVLLVFGLFYLFTEMGSGGKLSPFFKTPTQKIRQVWNKVWGTEREGLDIGDLTGYEEKVGDLSLFVIEGKVSNQSRFTKKKIRVKVVVLDQDKVKVAEKDAVCGRILSRQDLKSQAPAFFKGEMIVSPQEERDMVVPPGKMAPFMVVFRDPLSQAKEFKVEIVEAPNL